MSIMRSIIGQLLNASIITYVILLYNLCSERAGWIPNRGEVPESLAMEYKWIMGLSVTEMEIMHGAYRKDNPNCKLCIWIYIFFGVIFVPWPIYLALQKVSINNIWYLQIWFKCIISLGFFCQKEPTIVKRSNFKVSQRFCKKRKRKWVKLKSEGWKEISTVFLWTESSQSVDSVAKCTVIILATGGRHFL